MNTKLLTIALIFSITVNVTVVGSLFYFWKILQERDERPETVESEIIIRHPSVPLPDSDEIDSMMNAYRKNLKSLQIHIDQDRDKMVRILLSDSLKMDDLENAVITMNRKQAMAEKMTLRHLLDLKTEMQDAQWDSLVQSLAPDSLPYHLDEFEIDIELPHEFKMKMKKLNQLDSIELNERR